MYKRTLLIGILSLQALLICAQNRKGALHIQSAGSFSGWNLGLCASYRIRQFQPYAGPLVSLTRGTVGSSLVGWDAGLDYLIPTKLEHLQTYAEADYQCLFFTRNPKPQVIQEVHLSFGMRYDFLKRFFVALQMGAGGYHVSTWRENEQRRFGVNGYSNMLKLKAGWTF